ncbi:hypothetical protein QJS10_CPA10g01374 [Acorus calamus]|uniref:RING-type domain-containing protein n=1 Tax=Acorus calamus TaxID=4465 RepID=A0AAV9E0L9_ACOCL|nr:hypothetical protein QJS10_CPA10g01374 [Acorus calamus]
MLQILSTLIQMHKQCSSKDGADCNTALINFNTIKKMGLHMYAGDISATRITVIYRFFLEMVSLSDSKICPLILWIVGAVFISHLFLHRFIRSLQAEVEVLTEGFGRESFDITCNIILFRKFFTIENLGIAFALLLVKNLDLLAQKKTEHVQQGSHVSLLSQLRFAGLLLLLLVADALLIHSHAKHLIDTWQLSVSLYFSLEFMISLITTGLTLLKYILFSIDMRGEAQWERKLVSAYYLDLIRDVLCLSMNLCFLLTISLGLDIRLSLILVDKQWETFCNLKTRVADFVRCWELTSILNERYPDATPQERVVNADNCVICHEEMDTAKKLKCRHLFHFQCLRRWMMQTEQASCPICRSSIAPP